MKVFKRFHWTYVFVILFVFSFVIVNCGGGDGGPATPSTDGGGPFTGSFERAYAGVTDKGEDYYGSLVFNLTQNGNSVTGTFVRTDTLVSCCTVIVTVPVTGTADGNSADLSWEAGSRWCECREWRWTVEVPADSDHATLLDNDRTLSCDKGGEFIRM